MENEKKDNELAKERFVAQGFSADEENMEKFANINNYIQEIIKKKQEEKK